MLGEPRGMVVIGIPKRVRVVAVVPIAPRECEVDRGDERQEPGHHRQDLVCDDGALAVGIPLREGVDVI